MELSCCSVRSVARETSLSVNTVAVAWSSFRGDCPFNSSYFCELTRYYIWHQLAHALRPFFLGLAQEDDVP